MEVKILGTVSPYPYGNCNGPGYLISDGEQKIMLDCGSSISRQLNMMEDLENLTIFISHYHVDHFAGLLELAYASYVYHNLGYLTKPIKVYLPNPIVSYEHFSDNWGNEIDKPVMLPEYNFLKAIEASYMEFYTYGQEDKFKIGNINISFRRTIHDVETYSIKCEDNSGIIVYSSDTGYNGNRLTEFAKGANILICESTFLKGQIRNNDYHLYAHEAGRISQCSSINQLVLTHFWPDIDKQRYVNEAKDEFENTIAAEEGMVLILKK